MSPRPIDIASVLHDAALAAEGQGRNVDAQRAREALAAFLELTEAAELRNRAGRLTSRASHDARSEIAIAVGLDASASLADIAMAADDRLSVAKLTACGDDSTLARRMANNIIAAGARS